MAQIKKLSTELQVKDKLLDTSGDAGSSGQILSSTGTGTNWINAATFSGGTVANAATFSSLATFNNDILGNGHIYGRAVDGQSSRLYRFGGLYLTWDSDSYGTNDSHSLRSTYGNNFTDSITLNSYNHIRFNIDSNDNNSTSYFEVGDGVTDTSNVIFRLNQDGNINTTGNITFDSTTNHSLNSVVNLVLNADSDSNSSTAYRNIIFKSRGTETGRIDYEGNATFTGNVDYKPYHIPSTGGTAGWYKIGALSSFGQGGNVAVIEIEGHQGYNAANNQDYSIKLYFKTSNGNGGGPNNQNFNSWYERTGLNSSFIELVWKTSASNVYDLYMYIPTHSQYGYYTVRKSTGTWSHSGTSSSDPGANSSTILEATQLFNIDGPLTVESTATFAGNIQVGGFDDGSNYSATIGWNAVDSEAVGTKRSNLTFETGQTSVNQEDIYKWSIAMIAAPATVSGEEFGSDLAFLRSTRSNTYTDEPSLTLGRTGNATFAGNVTTSTGTLTINGGTENLLGSFVSTDSIAEIRIQDNSKYTRLLTVGTQFKIMPNNGSETLILDGNNDSATFKGSLTMPNYIIHDGDSDTQFGFSGANTFIVHTGGSDRFSITGDVGVVGATDFFIPQGRKLLLDGAGGHTYIEEESDSNLKFYVGGTEAMLVSNAGTHFTSTLTIPSYIYHASDPSTDTYFGFSGNDTFVVYTAAGKGIEIDSNRNVDFTGSVGVGVAGGSNAKLEVVSATGEVFRADAASGAFRIVADQTGVNTQGVLAHAGNATFSGDVTISGDLQVSGETTTTNVVNLDVSDNIIGLNRGSTSNANDSGLIIERGSTGNNAAFLWDEGDDTFVFGTTTANPAATGNITYAFAPIKAGSATFSGTVTADNIVKATNAGTENAMLQASATGTGYAGVYLDASNGDFSGNDYFSIVQKNDLSVEFDVRTNAGNTIFKSKGATNLTMDGANSTFSGDVSLGTGKSIYLSGTSGLRLLHDGSNAHIINGDTGDLNFKNDASDKDIYFTGTDGSTAVTALTLDMSEGGNATFAGTITTTSTATGAITLNGGTGVSTTGAFILRQNGDGSGNGMAITSSHATSHRIWKDADGVLNIGGSGNPNAFQQDITGNVTIEGDGTFSGDVGIGTMPSGGPQAALHVSGPFNTNAPTGNGVLMGLYNSTHGYIQLNGTSGGYIDFSVSGVDHKGRILYDNTSNYMRFDTNGSEKLRIASNGNATFTGAVTATAFGSTNIVTNKVVKFDGTYFNDSTITDTGSAITLGSATTISNKLFVDGGYGVQKGTYAERTFTSGYFANGTSNLGILLELQNVAIQGMLKITLSGSYSHQNITGELEVIIPFGFNPGSGNSSGIWGNGSNKAIRATGGIGDAFTVGDLAWSPSTQRHYIPIYKINSHGNSVKVRVQYFGGSAQEIENFNLTSPAAVTIPTEYQTKHKSITQGDLDLKGDLYIPGYINHTGDSGTAIGFDANDVIRLKTASSTALQIDSSQNVKVVAGKLQISGDNDHFVELVQSGDGDFTIDAPDDLRLDAGGGDVVLRAGGTEYARLTHNNTGLNVTTSESNSSIYLSPNGTGNVYASTDTFIITATEGEIAKLLLRTDEGDDNGDDWYIQNHTNNNLLFTNDRTGSQLANLTLTPQSPSSSAIATFAGDVVVGNRIQTAVGSSGAPTYTFTGKTDTGMYARDHSSNDRLAFSVDGSERGYFDSNGFQVVGNVYLNSGNSFRNYSGVWAATTGQTGNGFTFSNTADNSGAVLLSITSDSSSASASVATFSGKVSVGGGDISTAQMALKGQQSLLSFIRGTSGDAQFFMSSDSSKLYFTHTDIQSTNQILTLNSSDESATFAGDVLLGDGQKAKFGDNPDLQIYHNGSHSFIQDVGAGDLRLLASSIKLQNTSESNILTLASDLSATFAGSVTASGDIIASGQASPTISISSNTAGTGKTYSLISRFDGDFEIRNGNTNFLLIDGTANSATFAGVVIAPLGNKGAASYSFTGDTNTGMFSDSADTLKFAAGGNTMLHVNVNAGKVGVAGSLTVSSDIEDRDIPCLFNSNWYDGTSNAILLVPFNRHDNEATVSSKSYYHYLTMPAAGKVTKVVMRTVTGSASSGMTTQLFLYVNGSQVTSSSELTISGSTITWSPTSSNTFAEGDELSFGYQKNASGKTWDGVSMGIIVELTDYDI